MGDLLKAAKAGNMVEAVALLSRGENANQVGIEYNLTPLHLAALNGHLNIVELLLDNGAKTDVRDAWNCTPLHNAAGKGHEDVVNELVEFGANPDTETLKGKTPVDLAREKRFEDIVSILMKYRSERARKGTQGAKSRTNGNGGGGALNGSVHVRFNSQPSTIPNSATNALSPSREMEGSALEVSGRFRSERQELQLRMKSLEKKEQLHKLMKEHGKTQQRLESTRSQFDRELSEMKREASKVHAEMRAMEEQRDSEFVTLENRLVELQDSLNKLNSDD
jgi:hypothetical protein